MNKDQFLSVLAEALKKMPREERYRTLAYYDELIDDRVEEGENEYAVVESLGSPQTIANELLGVEEEEKNKTYSKSAKIWITVLLVLGFPLWGSLLLAAAMLVMVVYILLYIPILILGVLSISFFAGAILGIVGSPVLAINLGLFTGGLPAALFQLGGCIAILGLSLLCVVALVSVTKAIVKISRNIWRRFVAGVRHVGRGVRYE